MNRSLKRLNSAKSESGSNYFRKKLGILTPISSPFPFYRENKLPVLGYIFREVSYSRLLLPLITVVYSHFRLLLPFISCITGICCLVAKSCLTFVTLWTITHQIPQFIGFPRQEYQSRLPFPSPGDHPNPGIKPRSPVLQTDSLLTEL